MDPIVLDDLRYRITNLRAAIDDFTNEEPADLGEWSKGYRQGRLQSMESELRFLQGLIKVAA